MAIALKNVGDKQWTTVGRKQNSNVTYSYDQAGLTNAKNNCNGYDETWVASFTKNPSNVAKAKQQ